MTEPRAFDVGGPLPDTLTVLQASAGTGKTYALAALAVRYVAERDVPASALCIVSFTESATAELRGRIRARLVEAAHHLASGGDTDDPVLTALGDCAPAEAELRLARLQRAVADFDAATIATIHGFCRRVLAAAGSAPEGVITEGMTEIEEVVNDHMLTRFGSVTPLQVRPRAVVQLVRLALAMPDAGLFVPADGLTWRSAKNAELQRAESAQLQGVRELVTEAVAEVARRRAARRRRTFDSLLVEARDCLAGSGGSALVAQLRQRYRVVLVDEFQDTDRLQWDIIATAFVHGPTPSTVVLVGDPKQSIYRFRSADIAAYLDAVATASGNVASLATNRRSDGPVLAGLERLLDGFAFGGGGVQFERVAVAPGRERAALDGPAVELRHVDVPAGTKVPAIRRAVAPDVVRVVAGLLGGDTLVREEAGDRPLRARDIAVLTRSNADASLLALHLAAAGIPAATASTQTVLDTEAARQWGVLLRALERPGAAGRARAAALGWFVGWPVERVASLDDDGVAELHELLLEWSVALRTGGLPRLLALARATGLHERLLRQPGGERLLTDLDHVAELMQSYTGGVALTASSLLAALTALTDPDEDDGIAPEALGRRIDRDDDAVQVLTIHKAKGLEFGVVLCPYLWTSSSSSGPRHAADGSRRLLDCTSALPGITSERSDVTLKTASKAECEEEDRRLLYVAMTRAKHRLVVWCVPAITRSSPLRAVLEHALGDADTLAALDGAAAGAIALHPVPLDRDVPRRALPVTAAADLQVASARRHLTHDWREWSFTGITREVAAVVDAPEPVVAGGTDEPVLPGDDLVGAGWAGASPIDVLAAATVTDTTPSSPLAGLAGGTAFGTLVHAVLEAVDFTSPTLRDDLVADCAARLHYRPLPVTAEQLADGLLPVLRSPLGGPFGARRLCDVARADRLDELRFDMPLARLSSRRIAAVLADHLDDDDPLAPWARRAADSGVGVHLEGMLTGSIDLVTRIGGDTPRYWVADYKTNQLGLESRYHREVLVEAMEHHDYPLQAVLYLVALHRYLRWRVPGYDPERQLGGAAYLFLRGMSPDAGSDDPPGVLWWHPPAAAVVALDQLLAEGAAA